MKPKKILIITGSRAEYGILKPLLKKMDEDDYIEMNLIVTGMHLLKSHGLTVNEIINDGFRILRTVKMYDDSIQTISCYEKSEDNKTAYYSNALANGISGFTDVFIEHRPDMIVVFGDRLEPLAATLAAAMMQIPIAHIHGGDRTYSGHIDDNIRRSISSFTDIHFTATEKHTNRLIEMGIEEDRIFNVGALGLDSIVSHECASREEVMNKFGFDASNKVIMCIFHSIPIEKHIAGEQMHEILESIKELSIQTIIIYPNNDAGYDDIINEIEAYKELLFIRAVPNLSHSDYIDLLANVDVLVGNSSSGIIEAPVFGLPVINVGTRNIGREHANNVMFICNEKNKVVYKKDIIPAIEKALYDNEFKRNISNCSNPYGDGKASERIIKYIIKYFSG